MSKTYEERKELRDKLCIWMYSRKYESLPEKSVARAKIDEFMQLIEAELTEARIDELHLFSEAMKGQFVSSSDAGEFAKHGRSRLAELNKGKQS